MALSGGALCLGLALVDRAGSTTGSVRVFRQSKLEGIVEANIIPKLPANSVVLNWSNRAHWPRFSLPVMLFRAFAGNREFNPIGLVFDRLDVVEPYRFWQPFRDAKHGRVEALQLVETRFLKDVAG